jgi:predicted O-methyltransferase YrrM
MNLIADTTRKSFFFLAYSELRPSLRYIQKNYPYPLIGCEIGVSRGANAIRMLKNLNIKHLYLIDPDEKAVGKEMFKKHKTKIEFIFDYSYNAYKEIPDGSLDFCYIDGDHSYNGVKKDIELYYSKVKKGGVLCGHDFNIYGIAKAVCEYFKEQPVSVDGYPVDWWIKKQ